MSYGTKTGFAGFFRNLFGRSRDETETSSHTGDTEIISAATAGRAAAPAAQRQAVPPNCIQVPVASMMASLPLEVRSKVKTLNVGDAFITVPHSVVLSQLPQGAVRVPFKELRKAAPAAFHGGHDCDKVLVTLPLGEVLPRLNPALLARRPAQRQIAVSQDVLSPFDAGQQFTAAPAPSYAEPAPVEEELSVMAAPAPVVARVVNPKPVTPFVSKTIKPAPVAPAPVVAKPSAPIASPVFARQAAKTVSVPEEIPNPFMPKARVAVSKPAAPAPAPVAPAKPAPVVRMVNPVAPATPAAPSVSPSVHVPVPAPVAQPKPVAVGETATLSVPLAPLAAAWPDVLRDEIVKYKLADASVSLPVELVETSLKRGRVVFHWKTVRSWIRPAPANGASPHDGMEIELPLSVLAPLFLQRKSAGPRQQIKMDLDEAIPNLFFGTPRPETPAEAQPSDTNIYVFDDQCDSARVDETGFKKNVPGKTEFLAKITTPNEIISRAMHLENVEGALIALPDGLLVAGKVPPDMNAEAVAALMPQLFAKVRQCTKELRKGELNNLHFTLGNSSWKIFRVNAVFFAAFGEEGKQLPSAQLAALAAQLDHKNK